MTGEWFPRRYENKRYSHSQRLVEQPASVWWQPARDHGADRRIVNVLKRARARWEIRDERFGTEAACQARCDELNAGSAAPSKKQASQTDDQGGSMKLSEAGTANARRMFADGWTLKEIADTLHCGVYDLSPWIYQDDPVVAEGRALVEQAAIDAEHRA